MRPNGITIPCIPFLTSVLFGLSILTSGCAEIIQNYEPRSPVTTEVDPADSSIDGNAPAPGSGYGATESVQDSTTIPLAKSVGEESEPVPEIEEYSPTLEEFVARDMPTATHVADPVYPAQAQGREATVWIKALVDKEGKVREARVAISSGSNLGFDEAALEAARQYEYKPPIQNGKPVAIWVTYPVEFKLK